MRPSTARPIVNPTHAAGGDVPATDSPVANAVPRVRPGPTLPGRMLFLLLAAIALVGVSVYSLFPSAVGGPALPIDVDVDLALIDAGGGQKLSAKVVRLTNTSHAPIRHLSVILNGHYQLNRQSPIAAGETLTLPQSIFTDKRSSRRFNPAEAEIHKVVVRGQLPAGTRGVSVHEFSTSGSRRNDP